LEKVNQIQDRLARARELYNSVFASFQRKGVDSYKIGNILKLYPLVKAARDIETSEALPFLTEAARTYNEQFPTNAKMLDEDPVGNVITLAQYMMEAKEPSHRAIATEEVMAKMVQKLIAQKPTTSEVE
jgi:hypothetical protein